MATAPLFTGLDPYKLTGVTVTDRELGHGSYATVLELEYLGLKCAGKKIHELLLRQGDTSYTVRRFEEECRLLSQVRHPNIVQFLGVHFQQGVRAPILVMEFLHTNLTVCIDTYGILRKEISYSILHDVALGLCYLHSQSPRIIHRDLSSNNVLLTANMTAKIADLGVARMLNLTPLQMTKTPGTPVFMPPEVKVDNPKYDTSIDIFSCGVMMIHIFSGKWPESQIEENEIEIKRIISVSETHQPGEDSHTESRVELITRCIRADPGKRVGASEVLRRISDLKKKSPPLFDNQLDMLKRIDLQEEEKRMLKEEEEANIQEAQQKMDKLSRENIAYGNEIKDLQLRLKESDTEIQALRADKEHTVAELEHKHTLDKTRITTLMQEREESERQQASKRKAVEEELAEKTEQFEQQVSTERETVNKLSTVNHKLQSRITELTKKLNDLESEITSMKSKISEKDYALSRKDATIKSKCIILEAKNRAMKEKHTIISEMSQEISRAKQYVLDKQQVLLAHLQWRPCADIPTKLGVGTAVLISGKVYCRPGVAAKFTADDKDDNRYTVYCYDPLQDQWTTLPPIMVRCFGLGKIDDKLIAVGGFKKGGYIVNNEVYTYDERSKEWKQKIPPMPTARCAPGVLSLHEYSALAVVGGYIAGRDEYLKVVEIFKQDTLQWYKSDPIPIVARFDSSLTVIENTCYILGGQYAVDKFYNKVHYIPVDDLICNSVLASQTIHSGGSIAQQSAWKKLPDTPTYGPAVATLDGNLITIGGVTYSILGLSVNKSSAVHMYNPSSKSWIYIGDIPAAMTAAANLSPLDILVFAENASVYKGTPLLFK